jgi:hypothetical protein
LLLLFAVLLLLLPLLLYRVVKDLEDVGFGDCFVTG